MKKFKIWAEEKEQNQQNTIYGPLESGSQKKSWSAKKQEVLNFWKALSPMPLIINPISKDHEGSTFGEDGIRITGSPQFIYSIMSRLKDFLNLESDNTKLQILFKESDRLNPNKPNKKSYAFYIQVKQRGSKK